jgi:hypothetical protein
MEIEGKNLQLVKRALLSHVVYCSVKATRASDKEMEKTWDLEIKEAQDLLDAVNIKLKREEEAVENDIQFYP